MRQFVGTALSVFLLLSPSWAGGQQHLADQKARESYSLGYEFGSNLKRQGVEIDDDVLFSAIRDGLERKRPALGAEEIRNTLLALRKNLMVLQERRLQELAAKNLREGRAYLDTNRTKEGVKILPSGVQYQVLREGTGPVPSATDSVNVQYRGTLVDGQEFDSSYARGEPATVRVDGGIKGWTEALQLMKVGAKWRIFVPADLAYGPRPFGRIPPNSTLIFELELLSVAEGSDPTAEAPGLPPGTSAPEPMFRPVDADAAPR